VSKRASQSTISTTPKHWFLWNTFHFYFIILQSVTWIEIKLCKDDKDLSFYKIPQLIFPKNDSSNSKFWLFVTYKIKIPNTLRKLLKISRIETNFQVLTQIWMKYINKYSSRSNHIWLSMDHILQLVLKNHC